jgi:hypothetical protein
MTSPIVIRGAEQYSRWFNLDRLALPTSKRSEGKSRVLGGSIRLLPVIPYGFILLALCLLLSDSFHLAFKANQNVSPKTQSARNVRTVHGNSHARLSSAKRDSGV